jgi:hypothetical protein
MVQNNLGLRIFSCFACLNQDRKKRRLNFASSSKDNFVSYLVGFWLIIHEMKRISSETNQVYGSAVLNSACIKRPPLIRYIHIYSIHYTVHTHSYTSTAAYHLSSRIIFTIQPKYLAYSTTVISISRLTKLCIQFVSIFKIIKAFSLLIKISPLFFNSTTQ